MCPVTPSHILAHSGSLLGPLGHIQMMALSLLQQPTFDMMPFYSPPQSCKGVGRFLRKWQEIVPHQQAGLRQHPGSVMVELVEGFAAWGEHQKTKLLCIYSLFSPTCLPFKTGHAFSHPSLLNFAFLFHWKHCYFQTERSTAVSSATLYFLTAQSLLQCINKNRKHHNHILKGEK